MRSPKGLSHHQIKRGKLSGFPLFSFSGNDFHEDNREYFLKISNVPPEHFKEKIPIGRYFDRSCSGMAIHEKGMPPGHQVKMEGLIPHPPGSSDACYTKKWKVTPSFSEK
ncbi:MAG: hypothetical protein V4726_04600 [Verrucomicrobiota bacterium]